MILQESTEDKEDAYEKPSQWTGLLFGNEQGCIQFKIALKS